MKQTLCPHCKIRKKKIYKSGNTLSYCSECYKFVRKNWGKLPKRERNLKIDSLRNLKRLTRRYFPLDNQSCGSCGKKATERHHYSNPIEVHKFIFVCHPCHVILNRLKGGKKL
jgi:hypothetical protein